MEIPLQRNLGRSTTAPGKLKAIAARKCDDTAEIRSPDGAKRNPGPGPARCSIIALAWSPQNRSFPRNEAVLLDAFWQCLGDCKLPGSLQRIRKWNHRTVQYPDLFSRAHKKTFASFGLEPSNSATDASPDGPHRENNERRQVLHSPEC